MKVMVTGHTTVVAMNAFKLEAGLLHVEKDKFERPPCLAADYLAGRHWKVLVLLMVHTGMVGMVVCGGDKRKRRAVNCICLE